MSARTEVILTAAVVVGIAAIFARFVWSSFNHRPVGQRLAMAGFLTLMSLPGLWFSIYYLHLLPESVWLYRLRSFPASHLWLAFLIPAAVAWGVILPRWFRMLGLAGATAATLLPFYKPVFFPLADDRFRDDWKGNACLQSTFSTCGPASAASILRSLGDPEITERQLAREAWSSATGTEAWHLARALKKRGYEIHFSLDGLSSPKSFPGVLGVKVGGNGHFIAVMGAVDGQITYIDPLHGEGVLSLQELEDLYRPTGFFMAIGK